MRRGETHDATPDLVTLDADGNTLNRRFSSLGGKMDERKHKGGISSPGSVGATEDESAYAKLKRSMIPGTRFSDKVKGISFGAKVKIEVSP